MNYRKKMLAERFSGSAEDAQRLKELFAELHASFAKIEDFASTLEDTPAWIRARAELAGTYLDACYHILDPALAKYPELDDRH